MTTTNPNILIRPAALVDAATIAQFQIKMARETESKELDSLTVHAGVEAVFDDPSRGFYLVAEYEQTIAGSLLVTYEWSDWRNGNIWYIQSVYVSTNYRGRGIFKQLYQHVLQQAKKAGTAKIRLYVEKENTRAQQAYQANNMQPLPYFMYEADVSY